MAKTDAQVYERVRKRELRRFKMRHIMLLTALLDDLKNRFGEGFTVELARCELGTLGANTIELCQMLIEERGKKSAARRKK